MYMKIHTNEYSHPTYIVDMETGNITYGNFPFSGCWKFLGFSHIRRNEFISIQHIKENSELTKESSFWFKNGKSQFRARDLDHGTRREWGSRILSVWFTESL